MSKILTIELRSVTEFISAAFSHSKSSSSTRQPRASRWTCSEWLPAAGTTTAAAAGPCSGFKGREGRETGTCAAGTGAAAADRSSC